MTINTNPNSQRSINSIAQCLFDWLARWCCNGTPSTPAKISHWSEREWRIAKSIIIVHGMGPIIGYLLTRDGKQNSIPESMNEYLRNQFEQNSQRIKMISASKQHISKILQQNGIKFFCFKGLTISEQFYPDIGMRPMADIDIYTGQQDQQQLKQLFNQQGFTPHVIDREGMTLYPQCEQQATQWQGTNVIADADSLWYQGESPKLPYSIDIHFTMAQGIQEFRYDLDPMFRKALETNQQLTPEQHYFYLLLHGAKHLRCRGARWIQLYDLYLIPQQIPLDLQQILTLAIKHNCCHLLLWPLQLTRQLFNTESFSTKIGWLEQQLQQRTNWRYKYLLQRQQLAELSYCNPKNMGLLYSLLWTQNPTKIRQWLQLSKQATKTDSKRHNNELQKPSPFFNRVFNRITQHFNAAPRTQWQIFALQGLHPQKDWN